MEPGQRDRPVCALVGADDDGLPAALAPLLDVAQRQAELVADRAQAGADLHLVVVRHIASSRVDVAPDSDGDPTP